MPPRTPDVINAENAERRAKKIKAAKDEKAAAEIAFQVTINVDGAERTLVWELDRTTGRTGLDFWQQTRMTVREFTVELGRQALAGVLDPFTSACIAWLALRQAGEPANLGELLDLVDVGDLRHGDGSVAPADRPPKP